MTDNKEQQTNNLDIVLMAMYFFIPFYGLRIALETYLKEDDLDMSYVVLLGLVSGIVVSIYLTVLKTRTMKIRIICLVIVLTFVTLINLIVN